LLSHNCFTQKNAGKQPGNIDISGLRQSFTEAVGKDLEIVRDELKGRSTKNGGGNYQLVYVKPKRSRHFAIKYTYKYHDAFYEKGENSLYIRAGGKMCSNNFLTNLLILQPGDVFSIEYFHET